MFMLLHHYMNCLVFKLTFIYLFPYEFTIIETIIFHLYHASNTFCNISNGFRMQLTVITYFYWNNVTICYILRYVMMQLIQLTYKSILLLTYLSIKLNFFNFYISQHNLFISLSKVVKDNLCDWWLSVDNF